MSPRMSRRKLQKLDVSTTGANSIQSVHGLNALHSVLSGCCKVRTMVRRKVFVQEQAGGSWCVVMVESTSHVELGTPVSTERAHDRENTPQHNNKSIPIAPGDAPEPRTRTMSRGTSESGDFRIPYAPEPRTMSSVTSSAPPPNPVQCPRRTRRRKPPYAVECRVGRHTPPKHTVP